MPEIPDPLDRFTDEDLMDRYFQLSAAPEAHTEELAAIDAVIRARVGAVYGASPRVRYASPG